MKEHSIVSQEEWKAARLRLLEQEKEFTRSRDALSQARRELPWVRIAQDYRFEGKDGVCSLGDLFGDKSQLIVYHFMFGPDWEEGCPSCSFWADNYNGTLRHLEHRDISLALVSRAPLDKLQQYQERMEWSELKWYSSADSSFNFDFRVSFTPEEIETGDPNYNFETSFFGGEEAPGVSVFYKNESGEIFHTYSCFSRGLDILNAAYHHMDLVPKGRDEQGLPHSMAWLRRRDQYE